MSTEPSYRILNRSTIKTVHFIVLFLLLLPCSCRKLTETPETTDKPKISEILARPTGTTVTINLLSDMNTEVYWEYGTLPGSFTTKTETYSVIKDYPLEVVFGNLISGTKYYYKTRYRSNGSSGTFNAGFEHSFHTWRPAGSSFKFAIEADPHLDTNSDTAAYALTLKNVAAENPDFLIDLGDTFMSEKLPSPILQSDITSRYLWLRSFFERICHSIPLYLVLGNHDGELGWINSGSASLPVMVTNTRKLYFPNPVPDQFYSGNNRIETNVGQRQNYYAWEWSDALFVVLDPFWYTMVKSGWRYTLGKEQYDWFKEVISKSQAKFKFVFCHNLVGGNGNDARGGTEFADLFEMGGKNIDGTWGFDTNREGWGKPLHTIMKENNVTVFFHGHDHFYGKQEKDGIIYQEIPQPSNRNITNTSASEYGYVNGILLPGRGFLLVTVSALDVKVEYIGTYLPGEENAARKNATAIDTYTIN
jgi:3',5'-cyclic AMP phosphodiesterase CpdA